MGTFCRAPPSRNINIFIKFLRESSLSILLSILMFGSSQIKTSIKHPISGIAKAAGALAGVGVASSPGSGSETRPERGPEAG